MARLQRQWGVQFRHVLTGEWLEPVPMASQGDALSSVMLTDDTGAQARMVSRVASPWEVAPDGR